MSAGNVVNVEEAYAGSELVADVAAAATTITVEDPTDFQPDGGELRIGDDELGFEEVAYSSVDEDVGTIELDAGLAAAHSAEELVQVLPLTVERFAHVQLEEQDETLQARVPHGLYDRLPVGVRDPNQDELELVELERDPSGELVVADVLEREPFIDGSYIDPGTLPAPETSDGSPPSTSPAPDVRGGIRQLFISWVPVANADPVTYEVHVDDASGFTPSGATFAGEVRGTIFVVDELPGGGPLAYSTDYFVKVIAKDDDGSAAASAEGSAQLAQVNSPDIAANAVTAIHVLAEAIDAEHLSAVLVLGTTIVAGAPGAGRVELGVATDEAMGGMIGLHAIDEDGMTVNFMIDAETGQVYVHGRLDFGLGSRLLADDIVELLEQPIGFQNPARVQTAQTGFLGTATTRNVAWTAPTTKGNLLILAVTVFGHGTTVPSIPTPSGWTSIASRAQGTQRTTLFKIENAASRSGNQAVTWSVAGDPFTLMVSASIILAEYSGAAVQDVAAVTASDTDASLTVGPTATTTQAQELWLAAIAWSGSAGGRSGGPTDGFAIVAEQNSNGVPPASARVYLAEKIVAATGTASVTQAFTTGLTSQGILVTFKAKAATVETPDSGKVRVYARDVSGVARLHAMHESGEEGAVVLGKAGEVWRLEVLSLTINIPSVNAHSGDFIDVAVSGMASGDIVLDANTSTWSNSRYLVLRPFPSTNTLRLHYWNSNDATNDPPEQVYNFLWLRRS